MDDPDDSLLYVAAGPLAAIFLGMMLVPLRDFTLSQLEAAGPLESQLTKVLSGLRAALPVAAALVRDGRGRLVAASERAQMLPVPQEIVQPDTLLPPVISDRDLARRGLALP